MTTLDLSEIQAREACWRRGIVAAWYLRESQKDVYRLLHRTKFPFIEAARRFGKTNSILAFVIEQLMINPGWICRWCFPDKNTVREVMAAEIPKLQRSAPSDLRLEYHTIDSVWRLPNGSGIYIRGVNHDRGDSARGPGANIIVADEYGFWMEPEYIIREALFPQLENQPGQWLIKTSTPPENLGHRYYTEREEAIRKDRFVQKTIFDNEALSDEEIQIIIEESGGVDSPAFRRERLCEAVSDPEMLIIPEWLDEENIVPDDYPRPEFFTPYVGGDSGADDNTAILFGYYDFLKTEVVIEDEIVLNGKTTAHLVSLSKLKEVLNWNQIAPDLYSELWAKAEQTDTQKEITEIWAQARRKPHRRAYDASKQLIFDIFADHKWPVSMPPKDDKLAAVHDLRVEVGARRFKVKDKCKHLKRQLKVGVWKDKKHSDFERTEGLGHLDAIAAAIYFNRIIDRRLNPIPVNHGLHRETHFIAGLGPKSSEESLRRAFKFGQRRVR